MTTISYGLFALISDVPQKIPFVVYMMQLLVSHGKEFVEIEHISVTVKRGNAVYQTIGVMCFCFHRTAYCSVMFLHTLFVFSQSHRPSKKYREGLNSGLTGVTIVGTFVGPLLIYLWFRSASVTVGLPQFKVWFFWGFMPVPSMLATAHMFIDVLDEFYGMAEGVLSATNSQERLEAVTACRNSVIRKWGMFTHLHVIVVGVLFLSDVVIVCMFFLAGLGIDASEVQWFEGDVICRSYSDLENAFLKGTVEAASGLIGEFVLLMAQIVACASLNTRMQELGRETSHAALFQAIYQEKLLFPTFGITFSWKWFISVCVSATVGIAQLLIKSAGTHVQFAES